MRRSSRIQRKSILAEDVQLISTDDDETDFQLFKSSGSNNALKSIKNLKTPKKEECEKVAEILEEFDQHNGNGIENGGSVNSKHRGRFKKNDTKLTNASEEFSQNDDSDIETKSRSKKKKTDLKENLIQTQESDDERLSDSGTPSKKKRGRPKKTIVEKKPLDELKEENEEEDVVYISQTTDKNEELKNNTVKDNQEEFISLEENEELSSSKLKENVGTEFIAKDSKEDVIEDQTKTFGDTKKKSDFRFNLSKYKVAYANKDSLNPLLKTSIALQKHFPFKDHIKQSFSSKSDPKSEVDGFGLDSFKMSDTKPDEPEKLQSSIQTSLDTNDLYFDHTAPKSSKSTITSKNVDNLMKQSVLTDDLEKGEKAPKLFESKYQKKKLKKAKQEETAGKGWYNLPRPEMTDELKRDLQLIKMRNVLDTKRHYKRNDSNNLPKYFEVGTVVAGAHEFYSSRIPKKQRKRTIVDELLDDADLRRKNKKRLVEIKKKQMQGGKGFYKQKQNKGKPKWARK